MAIGPKYREKRQAEQDASAATKVTDAAVRRALVESRQLLSFLRRRLGNREEAEDALKRFQRLSARRCDGSLIPAGFLAC